MGTDKRWLPFRGRPLVAHAYTALAACAAPVHIFAGAGRHERLAAAFPEAAVHRDPGEGPLAAIAYALAAVPCRVALVVAADQPFVTPALLMGLVDACTTAAVPLVGGRPQVLCAALRGALAGAAAEAVAGGERSMTRWLAGLGDQVRWLTQDEWQALDPGASLLNLNSPADVERALWHEPNPGIRP
jgi:molybdopterin-guanine dinucleotide biosynthesis protein A